MAILIYWLLIDEVVLFLSAKGFAVATGMAIAMSLGAAVIGMSEITNSFFAAKGQGKMARNAAFAIGSINILGYTILVSF